MSTRCASVCLMISGFLVFAIASCLAAPRVYIDINQPGFEPIPVAIPEFNGQGGKMPELARKLSEQLMKDLDYSGIFKSLDPRSFLQSPEAMGMDQKSIDFSSWRTLGAEFLVRGQYQVEGDSISLEARLFDVIARRMILGKIYKGRVADWCLMIHKFGNEIVRVLTGEPGVFETKISFVEKEGKTREIYLINFDGSDPVQLTNNGSINLSPAWSPDGHRLAYVSYVNGPPEIFVADLVKRTFSKLCALTELNISPAWRPGSNELAVTLSLRGNPDIYLVKNDGTLVRPLVNTWAIEVSPSWSPDGTSLAYVSNETGSPQIYVLDLTTGSKRRLTFKGSYNTAPSWSPKGDWIAYTAMEKNRHDIFIISPDGSKLHRLTGGEGDNEAPTWSPDGRMIAFSSTREGSSAIWVMLVNGQGLRRLTHLPGQQVLPDWSPRFFKDGKS